MDATGNWVMPSAGLSQSSLLAQSARAESVVDGFGAGTIILDKGVPRLGRYRLLEMLGEGGQGVVHRAEDPSDGSIVAIKILRTDRVDNPDVLRRFRKEARLMAEANNPHVVNLIEFNEDDGIPYMVLEFVAGESLGHLLAKQVHLQETEALSFMAAVARVVDRGTSAESSTATSSPAISSFSIRAGQPPGRTPMNIHSHSIKCTAQGSATKCF